MRRFNPKALKKARRDARHSQQSLATALELSRGAISAYETGEMVPGANVLASIADELKQATDYFFAETDQNNKQKFRTTAAS